MKVFRKLFGKQKDKGMEERLERLSSSLTELTERMSSIEKETERIHEKINQLEEHQTLVNYGLMREIGMLGGNDNE